MVEAGWITLSGNVDWQFQKEAATDCVRHLSGVTGVSNEMALKPMIAMGSVQADIEAALKRVARSGAQNIAVSVTEDKVTLSGTVASWAERELATTTAWGTPGLRSVVNNMTLAF